MFHLNHIDHVAIRSAHPEISATWYTEVLGLSRRSIPEWEPFPIFMQSDEFGIAIFNANETIYPRANDTKSVRIDHIAFRVDELNFKKAQNHFQKINIDFDYQDHIYFHSIYIHDPDGHTIELTTFIRPFINTN